MYLEVTDEAHVSSVLLLLYPPVFFFCAAAEPTQEARRLGLSRLLFLSDWSIPWVFVPLRTSSITGVLLHLGVSCSSASVPLAKCFFFFFASCLI